MTEQDLAQHPQLDFDGPESLYKQLYVLIKEKIQNGELRPNEKIPSELWFSENFKISRITVRKAMEMLTEEDLIIKRSGKGSFVTPKKIQDSINGHLSFSLTCQVNNVTPHSEVITQELRDPSESDIQELGVSPDEKIVYIKRVRYADGNPIIIENAFLKIQFSYLLKEDLSDKSLFELISQTHPFEQGKSIRSIELSHATPSQAKLLQLKAGEATMISREVVKDTKDNTIFRIRQVIAGEQVRFVTLDNYNIK